MSTDKQQLSPLAQEDKIKHWFRFMTESGQIPSDAEFIGMFVDEAVTSRIDMLNRQYGQHILTVLDPGDTVVVASLSRAFRSVVDAHNTMATLKEAGINIVFLDLQVDMSSPVGKMIATVVAAFAELERDLISERTREALQARKKRGEAPPMPYHGWAIKVKGSGRSRTRILVPDNEERKIGCAARKLLRQGYSRTQLWADLNYYQRKRNRKQRGTSAYVSKAVAACLGFPRLSMKDCSEILGMNVDTIEFVRRTDHEDMRQIIASKEHEYVGQQ